MAGLISAYPPGIWLALLATGLMIGVLAGLLSVGGSVIAVPVLLEIFEAIGIDGTTLDRARLRRGGGPPCRADGWPPVREHER